MFQVLYDTPRGTQSYCVDPMSRDEAERQRDAFERRYFNSDGSGRKFPNSRGHYQFSNLRVEPIDCQEEFAMGSKYRRIS